MKFDINSREDIAVHEDWKAERGLNVHQGGTCPDVESMEFGFSGSNGDRYKNENGDGFREGSIYGYGFGNGDGTGDGIKVAHTNWHGVGEGYGFGLNYGDGDGDGYGCGEGDDLGDGEGDGFGDGFGMENGDGWIFFLANQ